MSSSIPTQRDFSIWEISNYIRLPSIIHLQLYNFWKSNAFLSVSQFWPALKPGGEQDRLCRLVKSKLSMIQLPQKLKKIFCFSYWINVMQSTLSSLLPYPINTIRIFYLTLLTNCILAPIFQPKEEHLKNIFTQSNNICGHYHQK